MSARFKLKPIVLTMMPILFAGSANFALAQDKEDEADKKKKEAELEVIQVKGYRGSVMRSINAKRLADGVQDSIFAEDIGKSTDQNIADALSRITGVTVQESDGEGTRISVRGANSSLNQISLNGVALTSSLNGGGGGSGESDQSVDLSSFSSDILSSINVIKTASADHDEGSLGANVILRTVKPLNVGENIRSLEIQGRYNDYAEKNDSKISGSFSEKFLDETVGIITTVSKETSHSRTDSLGGSWLAPYQVVDIPAGGATSQQTGLPTTESQKALMADGRSYSTGLNYRERTTGTVGIQWLASDDTDIQLDLSYSKASYESDTHRISVTKPNLDTKGNLVDDPQADWWTVDEESHTLTKTLNRFATGSLFRGVGGNETENKVATLKINHEITDDLSMEITAGYSKTDYATTPNASIGTANWKTTNGQNNLVDVPASELQPVGWDCTTGECILVTGDTNLSFVPQGNGNGNDNISNTGFSPYDIHGHHLGYIGRYNETSDDTNKSLFVDFDYVVDFAGITEIEFGGKISNRRKVVYTDYQSFSSAEDIVFDDRGNTINGVGASDINLVDVLAGQGIPVNDFMGGLVPKDSEYNTDYFNGWGILDPEKAIAEMFAIPNIEAQHNNNGDRDLEQDNVSAYLKFNFEYFDSRLTGNVGLRYVKTENSSFGYSSVNYSNTHGISVPYDLIYTKQLWNENATPCAPHTNVGTNDALLYEAWETPIACYDPNLRYDWGNGEGGGGANPDNWTNDGSFATTYDENGVPTESPGLYTSNGQGDISWWGNWRHLDFSTAKQYADDAVAEGVIEEQKDYWIRQYAGTGEGSSSILLPSLNLNYIITEDLIGRFAISKTMARPRFDSLRPGFTMNESVWSDGGNRISKTNPQLQPLESKNIDLSLEWYFNKSGLISLAYFRKDMSNFEEQVKAPVYVKDTRLDYGLESLNWEDYVILLGEEVQVTHPSGESTTINAVNPTNVDCLPYREVQGGINNPKNVSCREFTASVTRNGAETLTQGVEFSYNQSYDFLPGIWGGLGTNFNYTFANSESEAEFDEDLQLELKALPQAYTPRHSANTTLYWEQHGHQMRLTHRYNSDQLVNRSLFNGASWKEASSKMDFSATYKYNEHVTFTFHALNLTDEVSRTYYTSVSNELGVDSDGNKIILDEGNALTDDVNKSRTIGLSKTGRQYRLSARIRF